MGTYLAASWVAPLLNIVQQNKTTGGNGSIVRLAKVRQLCHASLTKFVGEDIMPADFRKCVLGHPGDARRTFAALGSLFNQIPSPWYKEHLSP